MSENKLKLFKHLKHDLPASIVVYLVALPLCLGVAFASTDVEGITGMPNIFSGIIAGVIGGIVVGSLSGSGLGVSGPAAGLITIVLGAIVALGSFEAFLVAVIIAGIIQVIAGYLKAGVIGYYFPSSVIKGMLAAIGIILILKEIPHAFGYDADFMGDESFLQPDGHNTFSEIYYALQKTNVGAIIISVVSLAVLILFEQKFMKKIKLFSFLPGALFVVVLGVVLNSVFGMIDPSLALSGENLVQLDVVRSMGDFQNLFTSPDFGVLSNPNVYIVGLTIAIIASLETLLSVEATDKLDPHKRITPTNRELKAQGVGNILSGLLGGLPITQVIVRSSANINSGGKTKMSTIFHGIILFLSVILIANVLNLIPLASLAAILLLIGYKLAKPSLIRGMYKLGWNQFLPFIVTIVVVVFTDLLKGIGVGILVAIVFILANYRFAITYSFKNMFFAFDKKKEGDKTTIILAEEVNFFNKGAISKVLSELPEGSTLEIDGTNSRYIDYDVKEIIQDFEALGAKAKNITITMKGVKKIKLMGGH